MPFLQAKRALFVALLVFSPVLSYAAAVLTAVGDKVIVYSGPGSAYRPVTLLALGAEVPASNTLVSAKEGRFYKVLIIQGTKKIVGYIPLNAEVRLKSSADSDEDVDKYGEVALIQKAVQLSFARYRNSHYSWTVGYMHYLSPGFYGKGFAGQWLGDNTTANIFGLELGNDALIYKNISGFITYGPGLVWSPQNENLFWGSRHLNFLFHAGAGFRLNAGGLGAVSLGATQAVVFNNNNSMATFGAQITLEAGL